MSQVTRVSIATTSRRAEIAKEVAYSFYRCAALSPTSQVDLGLGYRDSKLGGSAIPVLVDQKKYDFGFANPAGLARMGLLGAGPYKKKLNLRAIGVFPSWDRLVFAVRRDSGIHSLDEIKEKKYPLVVSTRAGGQFHTTLYVIDQVLRAHGFSFADIQKWGGKILRAQSPSDPARAEHIRSEKVHAVFDEGIKTWGERALASGMKFLPVRDDVLRKMQRLGFDAAALTKSTFPNLEQDIATVDFSGWAFFCHRKLSGKIAYGMALAIDRCRDKIEADHLDRTTMTMEEFCRGSEGGPLTIPLHPGAKKYYRERGYL
ncbi:MAG TPA: TAXI family TRAP transporter solute-binding subunit [Candidatus Binatia bacterium]